MSKAFTIKKLKFYDRLCRDRRLKGMASNVAWRIQDRISVEGDFAFPSLELMAAELDCNEKTVRRAINGLEKCGWFDIRRGRGEGNPHRYWLNLDNRTDLSSLGQNEARTGHTCPSEPDRTVQKNRTKVSKEPSKEPFKEPLSAPPPLRGGAAFQIRQKEKQMTKGNALLADPSPDANAQCLQGQNENEGYRNPGKASPDMSLPENIQAEMNRPLVDILGWEILGTACDLEDPASEFAGRVCRRSAEFHGIKWTPPEARAA